MATTKSNNFEECSPGNKASVRNYLRNNNEFASKEELRENTIAANWYIDGIASSNMFYTSLTHNGAYVASKFVIGNRADHNRLWRIEDNDEDIVFSRDQTTKATLRHLVFRRQAGLTPAEAADLLGRDCHKALLDLASVGKINRVDLGTANSIVYVHWWPSKSESQLTRRKTAMQIDLGDSPDPADEYLFVEELLSVFMATCSDQIDSARIERVAACLVRQLEGDSFDKLAMRLRRNHRLQDVLGYESAEDVEDASTLWRSFDALTSEELKDCLHELCSEVLETSEEDHAGSLLVVDGTHVEAWANTRDEIEDGEVEGAAWGHHEGKFYGYQVMLLVDPVEELPVGILVRPGNEAEKTLFEPLIKEFDERYGDEFDCDAVFADAEYDTESSRTDAEKVLDAELNTGLNPRRSASLSKIKQDIKDVFDEHESQIETPYDVFELMDQQFLMDYGVEVGNVEESRVYKAITERLNRPIRAAVERVIGRLKEFTGMASVRARKESTAHSHILLAAVTLAVIAVTAHRSDNHSMIRSASRILV